MRPCRFEDRIDPYLLDKLPEAERAEFEEHYFSCEPCFLEVRARDEIVRALKTRGVFAPAAAPERARAARPSLGFLAARWAAAGALVLAAVVVWRAVAPRPGLEPPALGPASGSEVLRGGSVAVTGPRGDLAEPPAVLEWARLGGGVDYQVTIHGPEGTVWSVPTAQPRVEVPDDVRAALKPGVGYDWQVKAFSAQGTLVAQSERVPFRVQSSGR